jgi:hypothetical protein
VRAVLLQAVVGRGLLLVHTVIPHPVIGDNKGPQAHWVGLEEEVSVFFEGDRPLLVTVPSEKKHTMYKRTRGVDIGDVSVLHDGRHSQL